MSFGLQRRVTRMPPGMDATTTPLWRSNPSRAHKAHTTAPKGDGPMGFVRYCGDPSGPHKVLIRCLEGIIHHMCAAQKCCPRPMRSCTVVVEVNGSSRLAVLPINAPSQSDVRTNLTRPGGILRAANGDCTPRWIRTSSARPTRRCGHTGAPSLRLCESARPLLDTSGRGVWRRHNRRSVLCGGGWRCEDCARLPLHGCAHLGSSHCIEMEHCQAPRRTFELNTTVLRGVKQMSHAMQDAYVQPKRLGNSRRRYDRHALH